MKPKNRKLINHTKMIKKIKIKKQDRSFGLKKIHRSKKEHLLDSNVKCSKPSNVQSSNQLINISRNWNLCYVSNSNYISDNPSIWLRRWVKCELKSRRKIRNSKKDRGTSKTRD